MSNFQWPNFYMQLANEILNKGYGSWGDNLAKLLNNAEENNKPLEYFNYLREDGNIKNICPFTLMGSFNRSMGIDKRREIARKLCELLDCGKLLSEIPQSFDGIPVLNNQNSWFYTSFDKRGSSDIENLWKIFKAAIDLKMADDATQDEKKSAFIKAFDIAQKITNVKWNLTQALYWVAPDYFPTLDSRSRTYISGKMKGIDEGVKDILTQNKISGDHYLKIRENLDEALLRNQDADDGVGEERFIRLSYQAWASEIFDFDKNKNIILYGPPGTGKTYTVQQQVREYIQNSDGIGAEKRQMKTVQFHPSYGYEDFIDGLRPRPVNGGIELVLHDGHLKSLCREAATELRASRMKSIEPKKYYFIADEINRAELSRVFGEALVCIEDSKRFDFEKTGALKSDAILIETQYGQMPGKGIFENDPADRRFGIPANLIFIGTMNDTDRSIDSFDLALRRRFVWQRMGFNSGVLRDSLGEKPEFKQDDQKIKSFIDACEKLNDLITGSGSNQWGLGESYEIGHAYFMGISGSKRSDRELLFDQRISPLLFEYLRSIYSNTDEIKKKIKISKDIFLDNSIEKKKASKSSIENSNDLS